VSTQPTEVKDGKSTFRWFRLTLWLAIFSVAGFVKFWLGWYGSLWMYSPLDTTIDTLLQPLDQTIGIALYGGAWTSILASVYLFKSSSFKLLWLIFGSTILIGLATHLYFFLKARQGAFYMLLIVLILIALLGAYCEYEYRCSSCLIY